MLRGKVVLKRIENKVSRQVTFSKRRGGLLKKAHELTVLCDVHLGLVIFSGTGKLFEYCSPHTSWRELIQRYDSITNAQHQGTDHDVDQQILADTARLRRERERDQLEASIRRQAGEDLSSLSTKELHNLQKQLESALGKVRKRKVRILEDQNNLLRHVINEDGHHRVATGTLAVATEGMASPMLPSTASGGFFPEVEEELSTSLQLWPQQHGGVHGFGMQDHGLQQW